MDLGLWLLPDSTGDLSLSLGRHGPEVIGQDLLGWWIVPIGIGVRFGVLALTNRISKALIRGMHWRQLGFCVMPGWKRLLLLGLLYLKSGRNLPAPIVAHGVTDTPDALIIYAGHYPGL
jgi:hypothetical protein